MFAVNHNAMHTNVLVPSFRFSQCHGAAAGLLERMEDTQGKGQQLPKPAGPHAAICSSLGCGTSQAAGRTHRGCPAVPPAEQAACPGADQMLRQQ